jgi:hypothetical protein
MKAIIKLDKGYDSFCLNDLILQLKSINLYFELVYDYAEFIKNNKDSSEQVILFYNEHQRIKNIHTLLNFLKDSGSQFSMVTDLKTNRIISFIPKKIYPTLIDIPFLSLTGYERANTFMASNLDISFEYLEKAIPPLFLTTRERLDYLKLTYNSLSYSSQDIDENLVIILNEPTKEVESYVQTLPCRKIKILENSGLQSINIAYQIFKPDKFIICEDDFIYPILTKMFYPEWLKEFGAKLDLYDMVGMSQTLSNVPSPVRFHYTEHIKYEGHLINEHLKGNLWCDQPKVITGQCLGIKGNFYTDVSKSIKATPIDTSLKNHSGKICMTTLLGYHIGRNQEMDGFKKLTDFSRYPSPKDNYEVEMDGKIIKVRPSDLWN